MNTLLAILQLFPQIVSSVQTIEAAAPVAKTGQAKLDLLTGILSQAYGVEQQAATLLPKDKFISVAQNITGQVVTFMNLVGIFHKSS